MRQTVRVTRPLCPQSTHYSTYSILDSALDYVNNGYRVLPLHGVTSSGLCTCGKQHCVRPGQHLRFIRSLRDATTDAATVERWWQKDISTNVGIMTGAGLVVIEVDPWRGGFLEHFRQLYAIPPTALVRTAMGSHQFYFKYNPAFVLRTTQNVLGNGIRSYGDGNYVVAPPSRGLDDNYRWVNTLEPVRLPSVLLPALLNPRSSRSSWSTDEMYPSPAARALAETLIRRPLLW